MGARQDAIAARGLGARALGIIQPTRRAVICSGGQLNTTGSAIAQAGLRYVMRLPVTTTRWRIKLRNYDTKLSAAQTAMNGLGVVFGDHAPGTLGQETGNFRSSAATSVASSGYTIPGDGSWWTSPWVTDPSLQFQASKQHVVGTAWSVASAMTVVRSNLQSFYFTTATDALDPTKTTSTTPGGIPLDMQIEYEAQTARKVFLVVGDSLDEGFGGDASLANTFYQNWPALWAARNRALAVNIAQPGMASFDWQNGFSADRWTRIDIASSACDGAILGLGANDLANSVTLASFKSNMALIVGNIRSIIGDKPIYLRNVMPKGYTGAQETLRLSYNTWLNNVPLGAVGVFDMDAAVRDPAANANLLAENSYDGVHCTRAGYNRMALAANGPLAV